MDNDNLTIQENFTCGRWNLTQDEYEFQKLHGWWVQGLASVTVGLFGMIVNMMTMVTLAKEEMKQLFFNKLLICLTIFDILFLINNLYESFRLHMIGIPDYCTLPGHVLIVLLPFRRMLMCCSIYMTLVLTIERYLAVAKPISQRNRSIGSSESKRVLKYISPVILVSLAYCAPLLFAFRIQSFPLSSYHNTSGSVLFHNSTIPEDSNSEDSTIQCLVPTDMRISKGYILWYTNVANFVVTGAVPFLSLVFFNCKIYLIIQSTKVPFVKVNLKDQQNLEIQPQTSRMIRQKSEELRQMLVLFGIVIVFFLCHILRIVLNIEEILTYEDLTQTYEKATKLGLYCTGVQFWTMITADVSHLLLQINSSTNFFIYCCFSKQFKVALKAKAIHFVHLCGHNSANSAESRRDSVAYMYSTRRNVDYDGTITTKYSERSQRTNKPQRDLSNETTKTNNQVTIEMQEIS